MKRALITGIAGQDGSYMAELLLAEGYRVFGLVQPGSDERFVPRDAVIIHGDLTDVQSIKTLIAESMPDEVYNFAGITDLKTAFADPARTMKINYESVGKLMEETMQANSKARFLQASSSEIFLPSPNPLAGDSPRAGIRSEKHTSEIHSQFPL